MAYQTREELISNLPAEAAVIDCEDGYTIHTVAENIWDMALDIGCKDAQDIVGMFYEVANKLGFEGSQF